MEIRRQCGLIASKMLQNQIIVKIIADYASLLSKWYYNQLTEQEKPNILINIDGKGKFPQGNQNIEKTAYTMCCAALINGTIWKYLQF